MAYGEKDISVLATILIMFIGQSPYSDMNNSLMKVVHIEIWKKSVLNDYY